MRHLRATAAVAPHPPRADALRRRARHRRRRTAAAASRARCSPRPTGWPRAAGLDGVALDTGIENRAARALYERTGFTPSALRPAPDERIARAVGGSGFVGYVKRAMHARERLGDARDLRLGHLPGRTAARATRAATRSQTGNSPGRWPKRSR